MAYIDEHTSPEARAELKGFQRWVIRRCDLTMSWEEFMGAKYQPANVRRDVTFPLLEVLQ